MFATLQLLLGLGLGRSALVADLVLSAAAVAACLVVVLRSQRTGQAPPSSPARPADVVAEAEAVVAGAAEHHPA